MVDMAQKGRHSRDFADAHGHPGRRQHEGNKRLAAYVKAEKQIAAEKKCQLVDLHGMFLKALKKKPAGQDKWLTATAFT